MNAADLVALCADAAERAGADPQSAEVLAEATVEAERVGNRAVGVAHLFDYLAGFREGRIARGAVPVVRRPAPAVLDVDAAEGLAQVAFAEAEPALREAARSCGIAALWIRNSFTCGELGYYPRRLATAGFLALGMANSTALMSVGGARTPVLGTNPLAYAVPRPGLLPFVIDQASSSTAYVNVRQAAADGRSIPAGWAIGPDGLPTQDAAAALLGALLPFGSHRGGNIALLVELLATLSGGAFSADSPPFDRGTDSPAIGVFVLAVDPAVFPGSIDRLNRQFEIWRDAYGVQLPALALTALPESVELSADTLHRLRAAGAR